LQDPREATIFYRDGREEKIELEVCENDMQYELAEFIRLVEEGESPDAYNERSRNAIRVLDQIRGILGIKFPNDYI
jgi:predicted dehydrogenase